MDRIATCSIIKGNGGVEAYVNGVVSEELRRQNAIREAEEAALRAELAVTRAGATGCWPKTCGCGAPCGSARCASACGTGSRTAGRG